MTRPKEGDIYGTCKQLVDLVLDDIATKMRTHLQYLAELISITNGREEKKFILNGEHISSRLKKFFNVWQTCNCVVNWHSRKR